MADTKTMFQLRELHDRLTELNHGLSQTDLVDEETIDALGELVSDMVHIVDRAKKAIDEESEHEPHPSALQERIESFESNHPRVVEFLSMVSETLGMMGI